MPDRDAVLVTGLSRVTLWRLEGQGLFPKRVQLSPGRVGRIGREVKAWIDSRPRAVKK
ncbi:MAG: AlpA family phage regulatory protein [Nitrospinae bacterium]|nr:AlpA family phage regulatory protein [Nitrospinota bacterium]